MPAIATCIGGERMYSHITQIIDVLLPCIYWRCIYRTLLLLFLALPQDFAKVCFDFIRKRATEHFSYTYFWVVCSYSHVNKNILENFVYRRPILDWHLKMTIFQKIAFCQFVSVLVPNTRIRMDDFLWHIMWVCVCSSAFA